MTKRSGAGSSPTKRAARRVEAEPPRSELVPQVDHATLVVEVHKRYLQSKKDGETFNTMVDATNQQQVASTT